MRFYTFLKKRNPHQYRKYVREKALAKKKIEKRKAQYTLSKAKQGAAEKLGEL